MKISELPKLQERLAGGVFAGITTRPEGTHCAVVLLTYQSADRLNWQAAMDWATSVDGALPTRQEQALLFANCKPHLEPVWHWSSETHDEDASYAWFCSFGYGGQDYYRKSYEGSAVAVRYIVLEGL